MTTKAEQIAGYLKLSSAHFTANGGNVEMILELRRKLAAEMDSETLTLAHDLKRIIGGWYDGDKCYSQAREAEAAYASVR
jgi:hypothetical protein